jgi:hypothetical protein
MDFAISNNNLACARTLGALDVTRGSRNSQHQRAIEVRRLEHAVFTHVCTA